MRQTWRHMLLVACGLLALSNAAQAAPISAGDSFTVTGGGSIRGGEFTLTSTSTPAAFDAFITFCIEVAQTITVPGGPYTVAALATSTSSGTALSGGAAYLYTSFAAGTLSGYTAAKENALQAALWKFQGYDAFVISGSTTVASYFAGSADAQGFYNLAGAQAWQASGVVGNVRVLQNVDSRQRNVQDFLTLVVPLRPTTCPSPPCSSWPRSASPVSPPGGAGSDRRSSLPPPPAPFAARGAAHTPASPPIMTLSTVRECERT